MCSSDLRPGNRGLLACRTTRELRLEFPRETGLILKCPVKVGSNHSILKEITPGCSLEVLMLKLKLQYVGHLM